MDRLKNRISKIRSDSLLLYFTLFSIYRTRPRLTVTFYSGAINAFLGRQIATTDVIALSKNIRMEVSFRNEDRFRH